MRDDMAQVNRYDSHAQVAADPFEQDTQRMTHPGPGLTSLLDHVAGAALLCDRMGRVLAANRTARSLPHLPGVLDDRGPLQSTQDRKHGEGSLCIERVLAGERLRDLPVEWDSQRLLLTTDLVPLDQGGDAILCVLRAETDTDDAVHSLRLATLGRLAAGVAHEFNNILTTIAGFSELAVAELDARHPVQAHLATIRGGADRLALLTRQLLTHVRAPVPVPKIVRINEVLEGLDVLVRRSLGEDIELVYRHDPLGAEVRVDVPQFEQVVLLLLAQVRESMPHGGQLTVRSQSVVLDVAHQGRTGTLAPGSYATLELVDTTPRDLLTRARHRFLRPLWSDRDARPSLATATARGLLQQFEGLLSDGEDLQDGVLFRAWLPTVARQPTVVPSTPLNHADWSGEATVLLVEDETSVRRFVADILQLKGYTVLEAGDGAEALRVQADYAGNIDILLTDVAMPVMDGRELVKRIRPVRPDMRVIYMSGYAYDVMAQQGVLDDDHDAFLAKPFTMRTLLEAMRAHVNAAARTVR
jgi:two-component system cell cycle sensor histidine kinase/response regulator CckA